jgi:hypothetical protein
MFPTNPYNLFLEKVSIPQAEGREKLAQAKGCAFCTPSAWVNDPLHHSSTEGGRGSLKGKNPVAIAMANRY